MNNKKSVLLLLILLIPLASAFELTSVQTSGSTCPSSTLLFTSTVFGSGDFTVNLDGVSWATAVPQGFSITNQNKIIYTYITPPSSTSPGNYNLNLIVSNNIKTETINYNINVNNCHNLILTGDSSKSICACNLDTLQFNLLNAGNYQETYNLNVQGAAEDWITLSQDSITLAPNEQKIIYAYANIPCNTNPNNYGFTLTATNTYSTTNIDSNIQVNNCFNFDLTTNKDYISMCDHSIETILLTINNQGSNTNKFNLNLEGPLFANLENNELLINGLQEQTTSLIFSPDYNVEGNYKTILKVTSDYGEIQKQKEITVDVRKCNSVLLDLVKNTDSICNSLSNTYQGKIKNIGEVIKEFKLESSEPWALLDTTLVNLQPSEEKIFNIEVTPTTPGTNKVYVKASALDSDLITSEDYITIDVISSENCYKPYIQADNIELTQDGSATLPITIQNKGTQPATYILAISGTATSFIQLNPGVLNLEPGESEIAYLYIAPSNQIEEGNYKATISVILDEVILENKNINIEVKESTNQITGQTTQVPVFYTNIKNWIISLLTPQQTELDQELDEITEQIDEEPIDDLDDINVLEDLNESMPQESIITRTLNAFNAYKMYLLYIVIAIIALVLLIIIYKAISKPRDEEIDFDEDFEEPEDLEEQKEDFDEDLEEEPLKVGRWIIGIVILAALVYLGYKYGLTTIKNFSIQVWNYIKSYSSTGLTYLSAYKYYLLIGLILLLILVLIIKYWKKIIDFFEEEDFEEEKPKKKKKKK